MHENTYKQKQANKTLTKNKLTKQKLANKKQQRQQLLGNENRLLVFGAFCAFWPLLRFLCLWNLFVKNKINRFEMVLMTSFTHTTKSKLFLMPPPPQKKKKLLSYFCWLRTVENSFWRTSLTYGKPCHTIGHFVFYYHYVTYRTPCHASGHLVIFRECYGFERRFFTLRRFLPYNPSC